MLAEHIKQVKPLKKKGTFTWADPRISTGTIIWIYTCKYAHQYPRICYVQSLDQDNSQIDGPVQTSDPSVVPVDCPCGCPHIIRCGHVYADWMTAIDRSLMLDLKKTFLSTRVGSNELISRQIKEMNFFPPWAIPATEALCTCINQCQHNFWSTRLCHPFLGSVWEDWLISCLVILPWVQSSDCC